MEKGEDAADHQASLPVVRWDGHSKTTSDWDGLKRDPDLWIASGDALIHLYNEGESAIGPSFRVPFSKVKESGYEPALLQRGTEYIHYESTQNGGEHAVRNLFIELPNTVDERQSFDWYITTRNFFAFCLRKPLLGRTTLGNAFIALHKRLVLWQSEAGQLDLCQYLEDVGYRNFAHSPDHALGVLRYAEYFEMERLWEIAFAHCVGMADVLAACPEYKELSTFSKCAIEEAAGRLSRQMSFACDALANFLEEDMSPTHLGLTAYDRGQLEQFRNFLTGFYSKKFGLWPAPSFYLFPKFLLLSVYHDFEKLYEFMVDPNSSDSLVDNRAASGGVCVLQNLNAFDQRHAFKPLKHPLPLFPTPQSGQLKRRLSLTKPLSRSNSLTLTVSAYSELSSRIEHAVQAATMVQAYRQFEEELMRPGTDFTSFCNGRKVRWILVYEILQILKSLIHKHPEADLSSEATYIVFWDGSTQLPWKENVVAVSKPSDNRPQAPKVLKEVDGNKDPRSNPKKQRHVSFLPDCETDNYLENIEVKKQSWLQSWLLRDPTTNAVKDLQKHANSEVCKPPQATKQSRKTLDFSQISRFPSVIKRVQSLSKSSGRRSTLTASLERGSRPESKDILTSVRPVTRDIHTSHSNMGSMLGTREGEVYVSYPSMMLDNYGSYIKIRTDLVGIS